MGLTCPCKYRLGIEATEATATVVVDGEESMLTESINFSAVQCFTGGPNCNPAVNNFTINFGGRPGSTINFTMGRRGMISCTGNTVATMTNGTARAAGNVLPMGDYTVNFSYTISGDTATVVISAFNEDGDSFDTTFEADVTPQTFIGACDETVGG
ncbi:hypothetical protein LCM10_13045 [Rossellomorea aquimaris]|uniref:hypothetical protein n=1 Tax=Rossellomorea aquimaris TaxID=189382 RepID=UPI001CD56453|nr:hypothetical protein [Rossellomorea aquimaris]MCA1055917.1 hypothetical protein [Rossellomorea aquimaris]